MNNLLIVWKDSDCFDIPIIDEQHRGLIILINSVFYLLRTKQAKEALPAISSAIQSYIKIHSLTEEGIMEAAGYPYVSHHKDLHDKLCSQSIIVSYQNRFLDDPLEILNLLKDWWLPHIREEDRAYVPYVRKYMHSLKLDKHTAKLYPEA